jgi:hypothetical protein
MSLIYKLLHPLSAEQRGGRGGEFMEAKDAKNIIESVEEFFYLADKYLLPFKYF